MARIQILRHLWTNFNTLYQKLENLNEVFTVLLTFLTYLGLWITKKSSCLNIFSAIIFRVFLIDLCILLQLLYLPQVKSIVEFTAVISVLAGYIRNACEITSFYFKIYKIQDLVEEIKHCAAEFEVNRKVSEEILSINKIFKKMLIFGQLMMIVSIISCILFDKVIFLMWTPFDIFHSLCFCLVFIYQITGSWYMINIDILIQFFPIYLMAFIVGFLEQLYEKLEKIKISNSTQNEVKEKLKKCVELHNKISQISKNVNEIFGVIFLIKAIITSILICTILFSMFAVSDMSMTTQYTAYIIYVLVIHLFIPSYHGSKLSETASKISNSLIQYEIYFENKEYQQDIKIMMEFVKKPMKITSFGLFDINLESFGRVCQWSYSLFAVCNKIKNKTQ
ncbi:hypothetical protein PVAND_013814 [Polypedilum vanderplanki]|uniref:Odorant receptor n=1 Tax=Polypedilum vanderplanki TaxID=319348 RepID=A0A9J6CRD7_POLVA|nr:hypothetical protein PVAND_013814 [Polypedilum vanderplanki]